MKARLTVTRRLVLEHGTPGTAQYRAIRDEGTAVKVWPYQGRNKDTWYMYLKPILWKSEDDAQTWEDKHYIVT